MKAQEEANIIVKESMESNTPVTQVKALNKQTKPLSASTQTKPNTNDESTQASVSDGTRFYNLLDDSIMEEVEIENKKKTKKGR